tara:strand:- start:370 stop:729 length:360 start_codon:yes stop_codon:yes gene_type:complete
MANTFKVVSHDVMPDTAGTPEALYTTPASTTSVVLGLILCNIDASQRLVDVKLVSDTTGGGRTEDNTTVFLLKDVPIPSGSTLEVLAGNKVVLETTDAIQIDCDVADKISVTLSIMEIT